MSEVLNITKSSYKEAAIEYIRLENTIETLKLQIAYCKDSLESAERLKSDLSFNKLGMLGHQEVKRIRNEQVSTNSL